MKRFMVCLAVLASACSSDDPPNVLTVTPTTATIDVGQTVQLSAELRSPEGALVPGATYSWTSSSASSASVSPSGLVTGIRGGSVTITASSGGLQQAAEITVNSVATRITLTPDTVRVLMGSTIQLVATVYSESDQVMPGVPVSYSMSAPIAFVSASGVLTGTGAGQATVTATTGTLHADSPVEITGHPAGVLGPRYTLGSRPFGIAVSPDSTFLVTQLDAGTMAKGRTNLAGFSGSIVVGGVPTSVAVSSTGDTAYVANQGSGDVGLAKFSQPAQGASVAVTGNPFFVISRQHSNMVYVTANDGSVTPINADTRTAAPSVNVGGAPNGLALLPESPTFLYASNMFGTVSEIALASFTVTRTFAIGGTLQGIVISPDGDELYVANEGGLLQVINLGTGEAQGAGPGTDYLFGLALSPDGKVLFGTRPSTGAVVMIDRATRQVISTVATGGTPRRVALDLLGTMAVVANETGWVDLIR